VCGVRGVETSGPKELFAFLSEALHVPILSKADYDNDNGTQVGALDCGYLPFLLLLASERRLASQ
jgi:hypothetical protein